MFHHILDTSGTGWSTNATADQVQTMHRHRAELGLTPVTPASAAPTATPTDRDLDLDWIAGAIAAGDHVYLVNLAETGAALAAYWSDLDHDGVLGSLTHGQTHRLVTTDGAGAWTAGTVADVATFLDRIEWLSRALPAAGLTAPVRRDVHTTDATWPATTLREVHSTLNHGGAVWTVDLSTDTALQLAREAGLPGIAEINCKLCIIPQLHPDTVRAFAADLALRWPAPTLEDEAAAIVTRSRGKSNMMHVLTERMRRNQEPIEPLLMFIDESVEGPETPTGDASRIAELMARVMREGRDDTVYLAGDPASSYRYERFVWTGRSGTLHSGSFNDLRSDLTDIAYVYALTADGQLVQVAWHVKSADTGLNGALRFTLVVNLPDGGSVSGTGRTTGRK